MSERANSIERIGRKMRIGILKADETPSGLFDRHGEYDGFYRRLLEVHGFEFVVFPVFDETFPEDLEQADGWLVTGSSHSAWDELPWINRLKVLIRKIYEDQRPLVGVCFGHQIIASALGGRVDRSPGGWNVGPVLYSRRDGGEDQTILAWHQDQVTVLPPGATVVGSSPTCEYAILRYGSHALTMQCHPELTPEYVQDLLSQHDGFLPEEMRLRTAQVVHQDLQADNVAIEIADFFKGAIARRRLEGL